MVNSHVCYVLVLVTGVCETG